MAVVSRIVLMVYGTNSIGLRIQRCSTTHIRLAMIDVLGTRRTSCIRPERCDQIHGWTTSLMPNVTCRRCNRMSWSTVSNAVDWSKIGPGERKKTTSSHGRQCRTTHALRRRSRSSGRWETRVTYPKKVSGGQIIHLLTTDKTIPIGVSRSKFGIFCMFCY